MVRFIGVALALAVASTAAVAFQEQKSGGSTGAQPVAPAQAKDLAIAPDTIAKPVQGTEVRIPGLGKLGVLPKMDFGLELLYGAAEGKPQEARPDQADDDGLRVQGTIKHRF